jgi:D-amino peptidase
VKIFISADMEGVSGVTHPAQLRAGHPDYLRYRRLMTEEVNAAAAGALDGGATEVVVNDSHLTMTNLLIEELHPSVSLISGANKLHGQMEGLDESFGGVFFVGYHEGDGLGDGVVNHTLSSLVLRAVHINGTLVDEAGINARVAASYGVPVLLLTGDDRVCAHAERALPGVAVAPVKRAIDRLSAQHLPVDKARALISERAARATRLLAEGTAPPLVDAPAATRFDVEFRSTSAAHAGTLFPAVQRVGPRKVAFELPTFMEAFRLFWGLAIVGLAVHDGVFGQG